MELNDFNIINKGRPSSEDTHIHTHTHMHVHTHTHIAKQNNKIDTNIDTI